MRTETQYNALNAIAKRCNSEIKIIDREDMEAIKEATDRFAVDAKLIGFSKTDMLIEIGCINGVLKNRRLD